MAGFFCFSALKASDAYSLLGSKKYCHDTSVINFPESQNIKRDIDIGDTVIFDLSSASIADDYFEFPVMINADDSVYSLDFSFQFNITDYAFNSIIDLTGNLQHLSHFNQGDLFLRFTSNDFNPYSNQVPLLLIRFNIINSVNCKIEMNTVKAYLNGFPCAFKITDCPIVTGNYNFTVKPSIYPNPVSDYLFAHCNPEDEVILYDQLGKAIATPIQQNTNQMVMYVADLHPGIYWLKIMSKKSVVFQKIIVRH
jgi:hypothetical protein